MNAYLKKILYSMLTGSLKAAAKAQGLCALSARLEEIVPDISEQYSSRKIEGQYLNRKVRNMHAFQVRLVAKVLEEFKEPFIVDIGDSAGTHLQYIKNIMPAGKNVKCLSVNIDSEAVDKIKRKGLNAMLAKAEDLPEYSIRPDIFLSFELLEHLPDPLKFLHGLSGTGAKYLVMTVPYIRRSRVGLHHIRKANSDIANAENTHIFELSPEDWKLLLRHAGWDIAGEDIYLQYPRIGPWRIMKGVWRRFDFEGFYGLILKKDDRWSSRYRDW